MKYFTFLALGIIGSLTLVLQIGPRLSLAKRPESNDARSEPAMRINRRTLIFVIPVLSICFASFVSVAGQTAVSYRFLEVLDSDGRPVEGATVQTLGTSPRHERTDRNGQLEKGLQIISGDFNTRGFKVSKPGYFSYEDIGVISGPFRDQSGQPLRLELLRVPTRDGENTSVENEQRKRDFFLAAKRGDVAVLREMLQAGLSANMTTVELRGIPFFGNVPLINFAALSGTGEAIITLLTAGADVRSREKPSNKALQYYLESASFLPGRFGVTARDAERKWIFEDGVQKLIVAGADVTAVTSDHQQTTLMLAARSGLGNTVKKLFDKGVPINAVDSFGNTALMLAARNEQVEIVRILLALKANPNIVTSESGICVSALTSAVQADSFDIIRALLANEADVNLACTDGQTALTYAVRFGYVKAVKPLIDAGANLKGKQGELALQYAFEKQAQGMNYKEVIELLRGAGARD